jgi:tetratricopeptide (TPR) repeat protein
VARSLLARRYAYSRFSQGRIDEALRWAELAAHHAEESCDKGALAQAWEMLNAIHAGSGRPEPLPYGLLALEANRELGDLAPQAHCLNNLAVEAFTHGRWGEALSQYRQATEIFRRIGDTAGEGNAAYNQAELLMRQGRHEEAAPLLAEVLLIARAVEDDELVALVLREQAQALADVADVDTGLALLDQARQRFTELDEADEVTVSDVVRAEMLLLAGRHEDAGRVLDDLVADGGPDRLDGVAARCHRISAGVRRSEGRLAEARDELLAGLEQAVAEEDRFEQALVLHDLVDLARASGEPEDPEMVSRARTILDAMGVLSAR